MAYLIAVVGAGCLANLALTLAVIRRLRRLSGRLPAAAARPRPPGGPRTPRLPVGGRVKEFAAATVAGERRTLSQLAAERSVVAFFSPHCHPCQVQLPEFIGYAGKVPGGPARVLAVVSGPADAAGDFARELAGVASVVVEPRRGPVATAFSVSGYPTFYVLGESGEVEASGPRVLDLAALPV
jgi:hypothetical protein